MSLTLKGREEIAKQNLDLETEPALKLVLVDDTYVFAETVDFVDDGSAGDVASHELNTTGYTPGFGSASRVVPGSRTITRDTPNTRIEFSHAGNTYVGLGPAVGGPVVGGVVYIVEKTHRTRTRGWWVSTIC